MLQRRFERTGRMEDLEDLEESIRRAQVAVDITSQDHQNMAVMLSKVTSLRANLRGWEGWKTWKGRFGKHKRR
jgi:hypothetical protein